MRDLMTVFVFNSLDEWVSAREANPGLNGLSPGGAAAYLGVHRQSIHTAVKRGKLDAVRVVEDGELKCIYITNDSIKRYLDNPSAEGRKPSLSGRLALAKDQVRHRVLMK